MLTKTKLAFALALTVGTGFALVDGAAAATRHQRQAPQAWQGGAGEFIQRPVALPYGYDGATGGGRFSGPQRTDSAPVTGGGY